MANGSVSSLYGCVGCAVKDAIMSKFPADFFKYSAVSSELPSRNMRRSLGSNTKNEITKRQLPYIYLQPTYAAMDQDGPFQDIPLTRNFDDLQYRVDRTYLMEVIKDTKYHYNLRYKLNRDKIEFEVNIVTRYLHQQLDLYKMMYNQFLWNRPHAFRIALEAVIPKNIIALISKVCEMDIEKHEEYIPILLQRMNACSMYPITYKLRNASATDEWFMYYTHDVIINYYDLEMDSGSRKNMVEDRYTVSFRVSVEFNLPGVFFLDGDLNRLRRIDLTLVTKDYSEPNDSYVPLFTITNLTERYPREYEGMQLYCSSLIKTDAKAFEKEDRTSIKDVLDADHMKVIHRARVWHMNPTTLLKIFVLKNRRQLEYGVDYRMDFNTMELVIFNPDNEATYRLIVYFNRETVNEILSNTTYDRNYDINKLKNNHFPNRSEDEGDFEVVSANSNRWQYAKDWYDYELVPDDKKDEEGIVIVEHDKNYCKGTEHNEINPELVLNESRIMIEGIYDNQIKKADDMWLKGTEPEGTKDYIVDDDNTYHPNEPKHQFVSDIRDKHPDGYDHDNEPRLINYKSFLEIPIDSDIDDIDDIDNP